MVVAGQTSVSKLEWIATLATLLFGCAIARQTSVSKLEWIATLRCASTFVVVSSQTSVSKLEWIATSLNLHFTYLFDSSD